MPIFRSVKTILQNSTSEMLTVEGFDVLSGDWSDNDQPSQDQIVSMQSTVNWVSQSTQVAVGTQAYVRLGCTKGYILICWQRAWVGDFEYATDLPDGLEAEVYCDLEEPARPVLVVTISPEVCGQVEPMAAVDVGIASANLGAASANVGAAIPLAPTGVAPAGEVKAVEELAPEAVAAKAPRKAVLPKSAKPIKKSTGSSKPGPSAGGKKDQAKLSQSARSQSSASDKS